MEQGLRKDANRHYLLTRVQADRPLHLVAVDIQVGSA